MGTGYTRNDTSNNIADGNIINAADLDGEFDAIESAMGTSGHTHDGTSAEGGPVTVLGPLQDFVASSTEIKPKTTNALDIGTSGLLFKDMFLNGVATVGSIKIDNAGTIGSASDGDAIAISSGGVVSFSQNTIGKTGSGYVLSLQTSDTTIEATNVLGKIEFSAPDEASGTDAILVGASIEALAEDTFDSSTNSSALVFKTNTSAAATERMRIKSDGNIVFTNPNGLTISNTADNFVIDAVGDIVLDSDDGDIQFKDTGTVFMNLYESSNNAMFYNPISDGDIKFQGKDDTSVITALTLDMSEAGNATFNGTVGTPAGSAAAPVYTFSTDTNTGMFKRGTDQLGFSAGGTESVAVTSTGIFADIVGAKTTNASLSLKASGTGSVVVNQDGVDRDFRVESDSNANGIVVDAGINAVGIMNAAVQNYALTVGGTGNFIKADNGINLRLETTDADAGEGPLQVMYRDSASPADGDILGQIYYQGRNDAAQTVTYALVSSEIADASDGTEDGKYKINTIISGNSRSRLNFEPGSTTFNDDSQDINFYFESNDNNALLFLDGGNNHVNIGSSTDRGGLLNVDGTTKGIVVRTTNSAAMELIYADNGAGVGPYLYLNRPSSSPAADDQLGRIIVQGKNSADEVIDYVRLVNQLLSPTDGSEQGRFAINTMTSGTMNSRLNILNGESVFNDESVNVDFRVESNNNANALFVDGGNDKIGMFTSNPTDYYADTVVITTPDEGGITLVTGTGHANYLAFADGTSGDARYRGYVYYDHNTDKLLLAANSSTKVSISASDVVFNENSADVDFRVESDSNANMLFVDAGNNKVLIGSGTSGDGAGTSAAVVYSAADSYTTTSVTSSGFSIDKINSSGNGQISVLGFRATGNGASHNAHGRIVLGQPVAASHASRFHFQLRKSNGNTAETLRMDPDYNVFNDDGNDMDFRVESDTNANAIFLDANESKIGFGTATPLDEVHIAFDRNNSGLIDTVGTSANAAGGIKIENVDGTTNSYAGLFLRANTGDIKIMSKYAGATNTANLEILQDRGDHVANMLEIGQGTTVLNDDDKDQNFRVETLANTNALFVDAGNETVNIGTADSNVADNSGSDRGINLLVGGQIRAATYQQSVLLLNRLNNDGQIVGFRQNGTEEGSISVSSNTVSYNGFAGRHESSGIPTTTAKGTVVSTIDELDVFLSGNSQGQTRANHAKVEVSNTVGDSCVYGVVDDFTDDGSVNVVSVGIGAVRVTGSCAKGDLLESNGDGTAKVQSDDIVRNKTLGKVTIGNSDTGVKLVPCVMYCG